MILNPDYNIQIFTLIDVIQRLGSTFHLVNASRDFHTQLGRFNELLMFDVPNKDKFSTTKKQKKQAKRMKKRFGSSISQFGRNNNFLQSQDPVDTLLRLADSIKALIIGEFYFTK